ncbi:MAG: hypothetical protein AAGE98_19570 [Actinomycetota bacterium]
MALTILLPAIAVVVALAALTIGLRTVEQELVALRHSLRRSTATAVATDDLTRASDQLRDRAERQYADARRRLGRRPRQWPQDPGRPR